MRKRTVYILLFLFPIVGFLGFTSPNNYFDIARNLDIFTTLFKEVNAYYVDEVEPEPLIKKGIYSMLASLDPYTNYIPEEDAEAYRSMTTGQYGGIGVVMGQIDSVVYATMLHKGFAAEKAGVKIGDVILEIDGELMKGKNPEEVTNHLKGNPGTKVTLKIQRTGVETPFQLEVKREKIEVANVPYFTMLDDEIGYMLLSEFTFGASKEVANTINTLKKKGAKGIVLDLRSNPGGLLNEAINVSNVFIPKGQEIVSTRGKVEEWNKSYKALNMAIDVEIPLVVLVNQISASASEIVAGVIQDYDRGVLVGRETFGKGLVQTTRPLKYNTQLKVTTARYYTPSGRCIQRLDYSHKDSKGMAAILPDSLQSEFKTANGRTVTGGGGLQPDIKTEGRKMALITQKLVAEGYIFKYANIYCSTRDSIGLARDFKLNDEEYEDFKNWVNKQNFNYPVELDNRIDKLSETAKNELLYEKFKQDIEAMQKSIDESKTHDLDKFSEEIKLILQKEIATRYYLFEGVIEATIFHDKDVEKAIEVLSDTSKYNTILSK